jgi:hypothetical protein
MKPLPKIQRLCLWLCVCLVILKQKELQSVAFHREIRSIAQRHTSSHALIDRSQVLVAQRRI